MPDKPNIILIITDQWRGDCLSILDHPVVHTPYLDGMALDGARFVNAYTSTPSCIPARASLLTGQKQRTHGRVGYRDGVNWDYPVTVASEFTRHGYQTQAVGKMHVYPERSQMGFQNVILHDGFLHFARRQSPRLDRIDDYLPWLRQHLGRDADYFEHGVNCNSVVARPWDKPEFLHPTNYVAGQSVDFLRRRDTRKPFFLYISFHRPHPPYDPPAWAFEQYVNQSMPDVPVGDWEEVFAEYSDPRRPDAQVGPIDPRMLQRARAGYYGHMTHIDHQINYFLEMLGDYGLDDNTYVCFMADHGELMGDHNLFRKAMPYEGSAHIPMLLKGPRGSGIKSGEAHEQVVSLGDVMPTLLDCADLPIPDSVEGNSFLPITKGRSTDWPKYLHGEHTALGQSLHFVTDGCEKYIWFSGTGHEQLFDLDKDRQELHDLAGDKKNADRLARWRAVLIEELTGREEGYTDGKKLIAGRPVHPCLSHLRQSAGID